MSWIKYLYKLRSFYFQLQLGSLSNKTIIRRKKTQLSDYPMSIHLIKDELWCCHLNGISIYSKDLKRLRQIKNREIGNVRSVIDIYDNAVVVGNTGIFIVPNTGETYICNIFMWYGRKSFL